MIDLSSSFGRAVQKHLDEQVVIWLTTVDTGGTPQPRPVWFLWDQERFLIFSQPGAHKVAHIRASPKVALHFNTDPTGDEHVIVFTGEAALVTDHPPAHDVPRYMAKYAEAIARLEMTPESFSREYSVAIEIRPADLRGWE